MRVNKILAVTFLTIFLPFSITFSQVDLTKNKATGAKGKSTTSKAEKPKPKSTVPEVPLTNARIAFEYTTFDFGTVPHGSKMTHYFPVRNIGPDTLYITKIKAG